MEKRFDYNFAYEEYLKVSEFFTKKGWKHSESGSLRRKREDVGDIDIVVCADEKLVLESFGEFARVDYRIDYFEFMLKSGIAVHLIPESEKMYNYTLWQSTGSKPHVKRVKDMYANKNKKIKIDFKDEKEIYDEINMEYLLPVERSY